MGALSICTIRWCDHLRIGIQAFEYTLEKKNRPLFCQNESLPSHQKRPNSQKPENLRQSGKAKCPPGIKRGNIYVE